MLKVGITGGIGSGKTIISMVFEQLGVPVYSADSAAKELIASDEQVKQQVVKEFGSGIYSETGTLDRENMAQIVFNDSEALNKLNSIVHPAVRAHFTAWFNDLGEIPYVLKEAAILIETGAYKELDAIIVISADKSLRMQRVMKRDDVEAGDVEQRMKNQMEDEEKLKLADYTIDNNGVVPVIPQILKIHEDIIGRAG